MDVETILLGVQERDKWRRRLETLQQSLRDVRDQRRRVETRLRRLKRELSKFHAVSEAVIDQHRTLRAGGRSPAATDAGPHLPAR
ncbi:MAG TPA: hypothetical protein VJS68_03030 [Thermoplasmata archaeon]|nr:hypothetical protein [Thermoplasmata archaeon]